jgi:acetyltransferase-like isoleucine patch superfamily enzyme
MNELINMPWRISNNGRRILAIPFIWFGFALNGVKWRSGWRIFGMPTLQRYRGSEISFGDGLWLRSWHASNPLAPNHACVFATRSANSVIRVGNNCGFTGASVVATDRIEIGDNVVVGANAVIVDTDFHPLNPAERLRDFNAGQHAPVFIENNVFIGMHSLILKGVRLGEGCVVGAGSVVSRDVPAGAVVAGNPAQVVRA